MSNFSGPPNYQEQEVLGQDGAPDEFLQTDFDEDEDFSPMFWASAQAALLTMVVHFFAPAYLALLWGARLELRLWNFVVPYFAIDAGLDTFARISKWSVIATAAVLIVYSLWSLIRGRRLQVQAGRSFGWLDVSLLGGLSLLRHHFVDDYSQPTQWMWSVVLVGVVGFSFVNIYLWGEYNRRVRINSAVALIAVERQRSLLATAEQSQLSEPIYYKPEAQTLPTNLATSSEHSTEVAARPDPEIVTAEPAPAQEQLVEAETETANASTKLGPEQDVEPEWVNPLKPKTQKVKKPEKSASRRKTDRKNKAAVPEAFKKAETKPKRKRNKPKKVTAAVTEKPKKVTAAVKKKVSNDGNISLIERLGS